VITMQLWGLLALVVIAGCGGAPARSARFALFPASWRTERAGGVDERAALRSGLSTVPSITTVDVPSCEDCADAARAAHADRAVATTLASLGGTVLARVSVIDVRGGTREETRQRVVREANDASVRQALFELGRAIAEPYAAEPAWYETWWPWTAAAAILLGAGVAVAVGVTVGSQNGPDIVVTPP
jgi:hypothetical protein